jgi:hypothetical protein
MIELTAQQQQTLDAAEQPPQVLDPRTNTAYVLVRADVYERIASLLGEAPQPRDAYPAVDRAFAEGWDDPGWTTTTDTKS